MFTKTAHICIHGQHEKHWQFVAEDGLNKDRTFKVDQDCEQGSKGAQPRYKMYLILSETLIGFILGP